MKKRNITGAGPRLTGAFYAERRKELFSRLPDKSVCIVVSNPERTRSNDTEHEYRQSSDVLYLTGFPEPESILVFTKNGRRNRMIMFVRPKDRSSETWTGKREGIQGAKNKFGADESYVIGKFTEVVSELIENAEHLYYRFERNPKLDAEFRAIWSEDQRTLLNPDHIIHEMRHVKTDLELDVMRHAAQISAGAHVEAMSLIRPGMTEGQIRSIVESVFGFNGAPDRAYNTIAAGGNNANTLHYTTNADTLRDGDLILIDAGCEYQGYASDITRTFPVNGKFSEAQRQIYNLVLASQLAAIRACKPGATMNQIHAAARHVLRKGLVELGILPASMRTLAGALKVEKEAKDAGRHDKIARLGRFYMHKTGHWLGLDVHDVLPNDDSRNMPLAPGMVLTVEPGLYLPKHDRTVPAKYRGIGIRIEDDVVITADGCEIISAGVPKSVDEIEQVMAKGKANSRRASKLLS